MGHWKFQAGQGKKRETGKFIVKHESGETEFSKFTDALFFYGRLPRYGSKAIWDVTTWPELIGCHEWDDDEKTL